MAKLRIYLVRHGETDANRQGVIQGQLDTQLNKLGKRQAELVASRFRSRSFDVAFTSDLRRATRTAEIILAYHQGATLIKQKELRERFLGDLQGMQMWSRRAMVINEKAETVEEFTKRVIKWWDGFILESSSLLPKADGTPHEIIVVAHGGVIKTLLRNLLKQDRLSCAEGVNLGKCGNTSVSTVEVGADGRDVLTLCGDISHLAESSGEDNLVDEIGV
ncbi:phosphoglycerate mutase-like protein [Amanita rubescens]|nr:phosphoglycerate mutase-like protein [Amanita rubescens]